MFPERGSGGEVPSPPEHKVHPIAIVTAVAYPNVDFMNELSRQPDSIFNAPDKAAPSNTIAIHQVVVEVIDCEVQSSSDASGPCVIASVAGIDGPMFGYPKFKDVRTKLMAVGYTKAAAEMLICDVVMRHLRFVGVNINKDYIHDPTNSHVNYGLSDQAHGTARYITRHPVKLGQLMGCYIPTPTQARATKIGSLADQGLWRKGQIPILLRPITVESMHAKWGRWMNLLAKNPGLHWDLMGAPAIANMALSFNEHAAVQGYKMCGILFQYAFNRCADLGVYAQKPVTDLNKVKGSYLFDQREVTKDTDFSGGKFQLNLGGNAPIPGLRAALYRHKTEGRLAVNGDDAGEVVVASEAETIAQLQVNLCNLIAPCDVIPGTFEGLVAKRFREDREQNAANKVTAEQMLNMPVGDPKDTLLAAAIRFNQYVMRMFLLTNTTNATDRSKAEFGEQLNLSRGFYANPAKKQGAKGMAADNTTELGRVLIAQDTVINKMQKASLQAVYQELTNAVGQSIRSNNANALGALLISTNFRYPQ